MPLLPAGQTVQLLVQLPFADRRQVQSAVERNSCFWDLCGQLQMSTSQLTTGNLPMVPSLPFHTKDI